MKNSRQRMGNCSQMMFLVGKNNTTLKRIIRIEEGDADAPVWPDLR
jgi:hypothetical protein